MYTYTYKQINSLQVLVYVYKNNFLINAKLCWINDSERYIQSLEKNGYINKSPDTNKFDECEFEKIVGKKRISELYLALYDELFYVLSSGQLKANNPVKAHGYSAYKICTTTDLNVLDSYRYMAMLMSNETCEQAKQIIEIHTF
jgi:hypothetical protein